METTPRSRDLRAQLAQHPFTVAEALAAGITPKALRHRSLDRPFRGVRSRGLDLEALEQRCRAYAVRMPPQHAFSHVTAARLMNLPTAAVSGVAR